MSVIIMSVIQLFEMYTSIGWYKLREPVKSFKDGPKFSGRKYRDLRVEGK